MKIFSILLFVMYTVAVQAQITLKVDFQSDEDDQIEIWMYDNFIVGSRHLVFSADRNITSIHEKLINTDHYGKILVKTQHHEKSYYVQPGYTYKIIIQSIGIIIDSKDKTNEMMLEIDKLHEEYTRKGVNRITGSYKNSYVPLLRDLVIQLDTHFTNNMYFNNLLQYKIAQIKLRIARETTDLESIDKIQEEYLTNSKVDYWNPRYINFISEYYYLRLTDSRLSHEQYNIREKPYLAYFNELAYAENETVKQIAALSFIKRGAQSYWGGTKEYTNHLLDSLLMNAINRTLKKSIVYTQKRLNGLNIGDQVRDFNYYDIENKEANLSQFKGKYVLLDFWFIGCTICHKALPELKKLKKEYEGCLEIVSINPIDDAGKVKKYTDRYNLSWNFFNARHDSNIKSYFNIDGYPTYFLIDPEGNFSLIPNHFEIRDIQKDMEAILKAGCE